MNKKKKHQNLNPVAQTVAVPKKNESSGLTHILALIAFCFLIFSPSLKSDFVNWDDDRNVYENKMVQNFDVKGIFTQNVIGNYNPLSIFSFAVEYKLFGMDPRIMHFTNLVLHLLCVFLSFQIFQLLGLRLWFALIAAGLFAIHPLRVESVSWITERKDVLYGLCFCLALLFYLKNLDQPKTWRSILIFSCFVLGLFAKIQMVSLPLAFLTVDYWRNRPLNFKRILEKWHYFLGAFIFGVVGILFLKEQGSLETNEAVHTGISRIFIGTYSLFVYLIKWLIPYRMSPLYPYPESLSILHYVSLPAALVLLSGIYIAYRKNMRGLVFGFSFFFVNIVFLLQILGAGQGYLADRFTYIAYIGLFFLLAYVLQEFIEKRQNLNSPILSFAGIYLIGLSFMSFQQTKIWKNSETLWTHVLKYYSNTPLPYNNRANYRRDQKQFDLALEDYNQAIRYKAGHATYNSRAKLFFQKNQDDKAILDYDQAIRMHPSAEYYVNRGAAKAKLGRIQESLEDLNKGLSLDPNWETGYLNRSIIFNQLGQYDKALADVEMYLKFQPRNADLIYESGRLQRALKQYEKALAQYTKAIQLKPQMGLFYLERGKTYEILGNKAAAEQDYIKAQKLGQAMQ